MAERRIRTTGAWREGLYLGKPPPSRRGATSLFVFALFALVALTCAGAAWLVSNVTMAMASPEVVPTTEAEIVYLIVPGSAPTRAARPAARTAATPVAATPQPAKAKAATPKPAGPLPVPAGKPPDSVNGIPFSQIVVITDAARQRIKQIYAQGRARGRNPRAFARIGDSTMVYPPFMAAFESAADYRLGPYAYLQPAIQFYDGSFGRVSGAAKKGMHTWTEFDPSWNNPTVCKAGETPLACELRLTNASIAFIRLGANDYEFPSDFSANLKRIVNFWISNGVIPVLGTKPDQADGANGPINQIIRQAAAANKIPLWDYDAVIGTVPGRGLEPDRIHIKGEGSHDYSSAAALQAGDSVEDLTALMMLDAVWRETQPAAK
ncbi:MAG: hypothetical protein ACM3JD_00770 [Rudaea sp.]